TAALEGLTIAEGEVPVLEVARVEASASFRDVLDGRLDFAKFKLVRPVLHLHAEKGGGTNLGRILATPEKDVALPGPGGLFVLRHAMFEDGQIEFDDAI